MAAETRSYSAIRGGAMMKSIFRCRRASASRMACFASNSRGRLRTPRAFSAGETASTMVLSERVSSATSSRAFSGSSPRATHSTEA